MAHERGNFATAVGCMDGRPHSAIRLWGLLHVGLKTRYQDEVTDAGLVGQLVGDHVDPQFEENLRHKIVDVSRGVHHSKAVIAWGHSGCAGHRVSDEQHMKDVVIAAGRIKEMVGEEVAVYPVFAFKRKILPGWKAREIDPQTNQLKKRFPLHRK